jgi:hypothetical protein
MPVTGGRVLGWSRSSRDSRDGRKRLARGADVDGALVNQEKNTTGFSFEAGFDVGLDGLGLCLYDQSAVDGKT